MTAASSVPNLSDPKLSYGKANGSDLIDLLIKNL